MAVLLLIGVVIIAVCALIVVLIVPQEHSGLGMRTMAKRDSQDYQDRFHRAYPDFNPDTGEGMDWDGTPYGAIDDLFTDADSDGDWDDSDGDGVPDDWD